MLLKAGKTRLSSWKLMRLYAVIVAAANDDLGLQWWLSQDTLCRRIPMRKQHVQDGLKDLQELGLIAKIGKRDRADLWVARIPGFDMMSQSGQDGLPDETESGHYGMPDTAQSNGHAGGHVTGQSNGHAGGHVIGQHGLPQTELEHKPNTNANADARKVSAQSSSFERVLNEALRIELEIIPTSKATAEQLLPRKRQKWASTIHQILTTYPAASADPRYVNALALMVLRAEHAGNPSFEVSPSTVQQLHQAERAATAAPTAADKPASPEWLAAYRASSFPDKFKRSKQVPDASAHCTASNLAADDQLTISKAAAAITNAISTESENNK